MPPEGSGARARRAIKVSLTDDVDPNASEKQRKCRDACFVADVALVVADPTIMGECDHRSRG
jgi:hypothetical protein